MAAMGHNKGTLMPGQMITVNKYTVQVDRYLSQGGFAHVYLVRTATPVYNTMYHVLKRMAVPDEKMLTEVKQEVDVMRLLKGHPNIVYLIDAASHRLQDGTYEVFILMEYCPGGGIIDMMNRRLRERLTEAEILTIFADVCEGVAHMHSARPPLLHRDLKVENILQASPTSYKLCDFGSAARPTRAPQSNSEIRSLELDLNRHTTLQYRAPEMVDVYLRRPVDEKSDVWALGVLLYKLCYYTTPFEEHGPLAILNVAYRAPLYPVYSDAMAGLIGSMLREHGVHRPTVFELLDSVHQLRGTKSQFQYNRPPPALMPVKSPRPAPSPNPLDTTISYRAAPQVAKLDFSTEHAPTASSSPSKNAGTQARDKVLEAIAPMRRGRPARQEGDQWLNEDNDAWKSAVQTAKPASKEDAWAVPHRASPAVPPSPGPRTGFGDDFSVPKQSRTPAAAASPAPPTPISVKSSITPRQPTAGSSQSYGKAMVKKDRDAFDGLGLAVASKREPTLGEARKLRTGLATMSIPFYNSSVASVTAKPHQHHHQPMRPTPSPQPQPNNLLPPTQPLKPSGSGSSWQALSRPSSQNGEDKNAEQRFPSLEELDAQFGSPQAPSSKPSGSSRTPQEQLSQTAHPSTGLSRRASARTPATHSNFDGVRSQQITGYAMREAGRKEGDYKVYEQKRAHHRSGSHATGPAALDRLDSNFRRPTPSKKRSASRARTPDQPRQPPTQSASGPSSQASTPPTLPPRPAAPSVQKKDWLTGDDDEESPLAKHYTTQPVVDAPHPVLRQSPLKRASVIQNHNVHIPEAIAGEQGLTSPAPHQMNSPTKSESGSVITRANRMFPALDPVTIDKEPQRNLGLTDNWSPVLPREREPESSADEEEPEDLGRLSKPPSPVKRGHKGRQSSVHDLVDLWGGGGASTSKEPARTTPAPSKGAPMKAQRRTTMMVSPTGGDFGIGDRVMSPGILPSKSQPTPSRLDKVSGSQAASSSPISPRGRPQSMFIFPTSDQTPSPAMPNNLVAPEEPRPRAVRRTSINDMVQKFEAIDAGSRVTGVAGLRPTPMKVAEQNGASGRSLATVQRPEHSHNASLPVPEDVPTPGGRISPSQYGRASPNHYRTLSRPVSPAPSQTHFQASQDATPVPQRTWSTKPGPIHTPVPRKAPIELGDLKNEPSQAQDQGDGRSPSPEKPYQGVGKLIDQWQKKAGDKDSGRTTPGARRGGMVAKRAGMIGGGAGRG